MNLSTFPPFFSFVPSLNLPLKVFPPSCFLHLVFFLHSFSYFPLVLFLLKRFLHLYLRSLSSIFSFVPSFPFSSFVPPFPLLKTFPPSFSSIPPHFLSFSPPDPFPSTFSSLPDLVTCYHSSAPRKCVSVALQMTDTSERALSQVA